MNLTLLFLLLASAAVLIAWGWKEKHAGLFQFGFFVVTLTGIAIFGTGFETGKLLSLEKIGTSYIPTYENLKVTVMPNSSIDMSLWGFATILFFIGLIGMIAGFNILVKKSKQFESRM
jgi:hypothetical protein